jgi:shikimate dehydrogenase
MAKAVVCALRDAGFKKGKIISRNQTKGTELAHQYGYEWQSPNLQNLSQAESHLLINATPIGMSGGAEVNDLAFSTSMIETAHFIFDVVAIPTETPLIRCAKSLGKQTISGSEVIVLQAVEQFVLYTGIRPQEELIAQATNFART